MPSAATRCYCSFWPWLTNVFSVFHTHKPDTASAESIFVGDESGDVYEHFLGPVTHEDFVVEPKSRSEFDCLLAEGLDEWEMEFTAFKPNSDTLGIAKRNAW